MLQGARVGGISSQQKRIPFAANFFNLHVVTYHYYKQQ
jgi:hypothetical protein